MPLLVCCDCNKQFERSKNWKKARCAECTVEVVRARNRGRARAKWLANPEAVRAKVAAWREANREKKNAYDRKYSKSPKGRARSTRKNLLVSLKRRGSLDFKCAECGCEFEPRCSWKLSTQKLCEPCLLKRKNAAERLKRRKGTKSQAEIIEEARQRRAADSTARIAAHQAKLEANRTSKPWLAPGLTGAERYRLRYKLDPEFNLRERLRAALRRKRQGARLAKIVRDAVVRNGRTSEAEAFLGYTIPDLRRHLERQFTPDMNWERFCSGEIHIDHIRPINAYDISNPDELRAAWALPNLRPLEAEENRKKSWKIELLL